jgi:selenocysteine-specific elongation factor
LIEPAPLTLGTAGHIDHGKTVLVEALTGTNTDRLPEERARGISIELGFAALELPSGRRLSVVDVPGHERFVRTMVAGASGIDLFLLVVAADDGVMPQTREHLAVLELLRVRSGVVALTKSDLVENDGVELAAAEVRELLENGPYADVDVVPVSVPARAGLDVLQAALDRVAAAAPMGERAQGPPRLHVDRSFSLRGAGTIVTGTLWSGELRSGQEVMIEPSGTLTRVRGLEVHGSACELAQAGQRVAVNLAGIDRRSIERGDVLTVRDGGLQPTYLVDVLMELVRGTRPVRRGARVHLHHGTRETAARVAPVEGDEIEPGRPAYVQLRLERPIVPAAGDRLVVRQVAPPDTIGGGLVIDPFPRKHGAGGSWVERLRLLERGDPGERVEAQLIASPSGLASDEVDAALLEHLAATGRARRVGRSRPRYLAPNHYESARERLLAALRAASATRPPSRGALADAAGVADDAARVLLEELEAEGEVSRSGQGFMARGAAAPDPLAGRLIDALRQDFLEPRGLEPLARSLAVAPDACREALDRLAATGELARVKRGVYFHPEAIAEARRLVAGICEREGSVTIATLRDELGTSRKYAQALLEHMDARRVTLRRGDEHVLRRGGMADGASVR